MNAFNKAAVILVLTLVAVSAAQGQDRPTGGPIVVVSSNKDTSIEGRPAGGGGGGGDIIVFDIVDSIVADQTSIEGRPAGGGDGGDIIVWDIVDSVATDQSTDSQTSNGVSGGKVSVSHFNITK